MKNTTWIFSTLIMTACVSSCWRSTHANQTLGAPPADSHPSDEMIIFDFNTNTDPNAWTVQDDVVMGGVSSGSFFINEAGNGVFFGNVSLENNGGFSSIQHDIELVNVADYSSAMIRLKGDGKRYQLRVKSSRSERYAYTYSFKTTGEWQTVEIPLKEMAPQFRGRKLDLPNYPGRAMEHVRFLIANGAQESFQLETDKIWLK